MASHLHLRLACRAPPVRVLQKAIPSMSESAPLPTLASPEGTYNRRFWIAFAANVVLVTANTMTFRFAEFVKFLGGTEEITGRIVSVGLIGSLVLRVFLGQAMDRFGIRRVWLTSAVLFVLGNLLLMSCQDVGLQVYLARFTFILGLASMFACSVAHIQEIAPPERRTEIIGTFGASGFIGMVTGAQGADYLFAHLPNGHRLYLLLFGISAALGMCNLVLALWVTHDDEHASPAVTPPFYRLMHYWPTSILIVTALMGLGFAVTTVFLTRYATSLGLPGIRTYFTAYAITAFSVRILARNWSRSMGRYRLILVGLAAHVVGQLLFIPITQDWQLIPPAVCGGFGHALLWPCVVSLGAGGFPVEYRGTGTAITLASVDIGQIMLAPLLGWIIDQHGFEPMFLLVAGTILTCGAVYGLLTFKILDPESLLGVELQSVPSEKLSTAIAAPVHANKSREKRHKSQRSAVLAGRR